MVSEKNFLISLESCFLFVCDMNLSQAADTVFRKKWQFLNSKPHLRILFWFLYVLLLISLQVHSDINISFEQCRHTYWGGVVLLVCFLLLFCCLFAFYKNACVSPYCPFCSFTILSTYEIDFLPISAGYKVLNQYTYSWK